MSMHKCPDCGKLHLILSDPSNPYCRPCSEAYYATVMADTLKSYNADMRADHNANMLDLEVEMGVPRGLFGRC